MKNRTVAFVELTTFFFSWIDMTSTILSIVLYLRFSCCHFFEQSIVFLVAGELFYATYYVNFTLFSLFLAISLTLSSVQILLKQWLSTTCIWISAVLLVFGICLCLWLMLPFRLSSYLSISAENMRQPNVWLTLLFWFFSSSLLRWNILQLEISWFTRSLVLVILKWRLISRCAWKQADKEI